MEDLCFFGLLPELNLAWVSVDDALCLWSPATTSTIARELCEKDLDWCKDGPRPPARTLHCKDYVTAVALVKPDPSKQLDCDGMQLFFLAVSLSALG
ncbi:hypothetical protein T484DRAFT_1777544 [Baffinella frigidus]|nr:hypothetical protein T484DRAFT_1777544 [Cryptophyta sp. CCMP2293]